MEKRKQEHEFLFSGSIELHGVQFIVKAANREHAIEKAMAGQYEEYDTRGAETVNWELNPNTIESNE